MAVPIGYGENTTFPRRGDGQPRAPRPQPEPETLPVDRPFPFYLVDDTTGAILFQGRIVDPR